MNKTDLIDAIAADASITKVAAKSALESFLKNVSETLQKGDKVALVGFGSWSVSKREAREGRNPQTGDIGHRGGGCYSVPCRCQQWHNRP